MQRYLFPLGVVVLLTGGAIYFAATRPGSVPATPVVAEAKEEPRLEASEPRESEPSAKAPEPAPRTATRHARLTIKAGEPIPELFPFQAERERLYNLAASFDPANIPVIAEHLAHEDAGVREAARLSLIQTSDRRAVPYLQRAAAKTPDPVERQELVKAAEFLSLPQFIDLMIAHARQNQSGAQGNQSPAPSSP
jgi:hypothetical protein